MSLLMIGCGKMGGALLGRWATQLDHQITIVDPALTSAPATVTLCADIKALGEKRFDIIIVAIKPQLIEVVLPAYAAHLADNGCVISIAAGYAVASIEKTIGPLPVIRVMPNLPAQIGRGVSALYANDRCTAEHIAWASGLTDAAGHTLLVDTEDAIDKVTAVAGSGPGYAFEIARCWINAAETLGFSAAEARDLVLNTLVGSIEMAIQSDQSMDDLRESVTSKNGTTEAGLKILRKDKAIDALFNETIKAAYERAIELR